ncbi:MAG: LacI family DNA-binding transcriptional regulator, partial [Planctomycetota bacterium]
MATLKDIARIAGTSEATVSLVLNGKQFHRVSEKMREKIEAIARDLQYQPNRQAQVLASGRTMTIAVLVNTLTNAFYSGYVGRLELRLSERGYNVSPFETLSDPDRERHMLQMASRKMCDAIISLDHSVDPVADEAISGEPVVARVEDFDDELVLAPSLPSVQIDYAPATRAMFEHFKKEGARRLALVMSKNHQLDAPDPSLRASFFRSLVESSGWASDLATVAISEAVPSEEWFEATRSLLERNPGVDALYVHNAHVAPPVLAAITASGRAVGRDNAVATVD